MKITKEAISLFQQGFRSEGRGESFTLITPEGKRHHYFWSHKTDITIPDEDELTAWVLQPGGSDNDLVFDFPLTDLLLIRMQMYNAMVGGFLCEIERLSEAGKKVVNQFRELLKEYDQEFQDEINVEHGSRSAIMLIRTCASLCLKGADLDQFLTDLDMLVKKPIPRGYL